MQTDLKVEVREAQRSKSGLTPEGHDGRTVSYVNSVVNMSAQGRIQLGANGGVDTKRGVG